MHFRPVSETLPPTLLLPSHYIVKGSFTLPSLVSEERKLSIIPNREEKGWASRSRNPMPVLGTVRIVPFTSRQPKEALLHPVTRIAPSLLSG